MKKLNANVKAFFTKEGRSQDGIFLLAVAAILAVNVLLFVIVNAFGLYLYEIPRDDLSISGNTDELFEDAVLREEKIKISFLMTKEQIVQHVNGSYVHETALNFKARYPELVELEYINILTQRDSSGKLVDLGKYKTDMRGDPQDVLKTSVIFECGNNQRVLTDAYTSDGFAGFYTMDSSGKATSYNGEEVMAGMMAWVLSNEHKTVYFTQHHGETADVALSNLLVCAGYYVDTIDLRNERVPDDAELVFISNPRTDFERAAEDSGIITEIERLENYLKRGGNLYVTLDPYVKELPVLEAFLAEYGIAFSSTELDNGRIAHNIVKDSVSAITVDGFTLVTEYTDDPLSASIAEKVNKYNDDADVIIRDASHLTLTGNAKPLLKTSSSSVLQAGGTTVDSSGSYTVAAYSKLTPENGEGESTILVVPSIYLAVSDSLVSRGYSNKDFNYAVLEELFGAGKMPYGCRAVLTDTTTLQNLTMGTAKLYTALLMLVPVAVAVVGGIIIVRRKNS